VKTSAPSIVKNPGHAVSVRQLVCRCGGRSPLRPGAAATQLHEEGLVAGYGG
jgi:hypothetical protein